MEAYNPDLINIPGKYLFRVSVNWFEWMFLLSTILRSTQTTIVPD
jgi:hypothetical protein